MCPLDTLRNKVEYPFVSPIAVARGCDIDKPRNLAKSVTVE